MTDHNFRESLQKSEEDGQSEDWDLIYEHFWPKYTARYDDSKNMALQMSGIDDIIFDEAGKTVWIDRKVRFERKDGNIYKDILLELYSDKDRKVPGWTWKESKVDYILYLNRMCNECHCIPFPQLKKVFLDKKVEWAVEYRIREAYNPSWITTNIPVPLSVLRELLPEMRSVSLCDLKPRKPFEKKPVVEIIKESSERPKSCKEIF